MKCALLLRRLCKSPAPRRFLVQLDLLRVECAGSMEPFMELSRTRIDLQRERGGRTCAEPKAAVGTAPLTPALAGTRCGREVVKCLSRAKRQLPPFVDLPVTGGWLPPGP